MYEGCGNLADRLEAFRAQLSLDYAAVARVDGRDNRIRYDCVIGNMTNRHVQMVNRPGNGIAGQVVRHGRPVFVDASRTDLAELKLQYPIMLAEKLEAVLAVPVYNEDKVAGVLLGAVRRERSFTSAEVELAEQQAQDMVAILRDDAIKT